MKLRSLALACSVFALCLHAGCSSDPPTTLNTGAGGAAGAGGAGGSAPCSGPLVAPTGDCATCVNANCSSEIVAAVGTRWQLGNLSNGDCGTYVTCYDACCGDQGCEVGCMPPSTQCSTDLETFTACEALSCSSTCGVMSTGATMMNVTVTCFVASADTCTSKTVSPGGADAFKAGCTGQGGVVGMACPTANLTGCCKGATREVCDYNADPTQSQTDCEDSGGTWSTSM